MSGVVNEKRVRSVIAEYIRTSGNPDMLAYLGSVADELSAPGQSRFYWTMHHLARLAGIRPGHRVLDIGCGFGHHSVALSMLGDCTVVANDVRETMTRPIVERMGWLKERGIEPKVEALTGDVCDLKLPSESFDSMVCLQTIEHVRDLELMFKECYRLLKPGGRLVATNDNNVLNKAHADECRAMWKLRDSSWEHIAELKKLRPIENADAEPYAVMRERIVRTAAPALDEGAVRAVVEATAGLVRVEIEDVARSVQANGLAGTTLPTPPKLHPCRNPETGEYCERQLDPYDVASKAEAVGFGAWAGHAFRKWPLSMFNRVRFGPLNQALYNRRPIFVVVATKPLRERASAGLGLLERLKLGVMGTGIEAVELAFLC